MKKQEYVSPEMEIVEIKAQHSILSVSDGSLGDGEKRPGTVPPED